jgi:ketosteroid isomerase-like protein
MSQQDVEVVRRWIELFNRRDTTGLIRLTEPDFEMKSLLLAIESDFRGDADFPHAYFEALDDAYDHFQSVPEDFIDAGAAVLVVTHLHWRGKGSGAHGQTPIVAAFWLRAGKVFREETFTDRADALEAVGLSEQEPQPSTSKPK